MLKETESASPSCATRTIFEHHSTCGCTRVSRSSVMRRSRAATWRLCRASRTCHSFVLWCTTGRQTRTRLSGYGVIMLIQRASRWIELHDRQEEEIEASGYCESTIRKGELFPRARTEIAEFE